MRRRHESRARDDGSLHAWGANDHGQLGVGDAKDRRAPAAAALAAAALDANAAARSHSAALTADAGWARAVLGPVRDEDGRARRAPRRRRRSRAAAAPAGAPAVAAAARRRAPSATCCGAARRARVGDALGAAARFPEVRPPAGHRFVAVAAEGSRAAASRSRTPARGTRRAAAQRAQLRTRHPSAR